MGREGELHLIEDRDWPISLPGQWAGAACAWRGRRPRFPLIRAVGAEKRRTRKPALEVWERMPERRSLDESTATPRQALMSQKGVSFRPSRLASQVGHSFVLLESHATSTVMSHLSCLRVMSRA